MSDNYTIEEVCGMINQYITERAPRGAYKKYLKMKDKEYSDEMKRADKAHELVKYNKHAEDKVDRHLGNAYYANDMFARATGDSINNVKKAIGSKSDVGRDTIAFVKNRLGQGKENMKSELEKKPAGLYTTKKESAHIIDTKLAIYESCDAGYITEDEKYELLNMIESEVISEKVDPETKSAATWMLGTGAASALSAWLTMNNIFTIADLNDAIKTTTKDIKEEKERSKPNTTKIKELEERLKKLKFARGKKAILTALTGGSAVFTGALAKASYDNL